MKPEKLSPEWVDYAYNEYSYLEDEQSAFIDGAQRYQSKVVELIEAKLKHFTDEKDKEQKISTEYKNIQYIVYCSCMIQEYKQLLTDLTNLKP